MNKIFGENFIRFVAPSAQLIIEPDSKKNEQPVTNKCPKKENETSVDLLKVPTLGKQV